MRKDMAKVVTERPRIGHGAPSRKTGLRLHGVQANAGEEDDGTFAYADVKASRLGQCRDRRPGSADCHKQFSDLLGPLRGYLHKQVGRPWNAIYADLCQTLDRRTLAGRHIWQHVNMEVEQHCVLAADGTVRRSVTNLGVHQPMGFYVHPRTGLLRWNGDRRQPWRTEAWQLSRTLRRYPGIVPMRAPVIVADWKVVDETHLLQRINGVWFVHVYRRDRTVPLPDVIAPAIIRRAGEPPALEHVVTRRVGVRETKAWGL